MHGTAAERWQEPKSGAKVRPEQMASDYYPVNVDEDSDQERISITFTAQQIEDLKLIAEIWNALDRALGIERKKWKLQGVVSRLINVGSDAVWQQLGGRPTTKAERDQFVRDVADRISKQKKK